MPSKRILQMENSGLGRSCSRALLPKKAFAAKFVYHKSSPVPRTSIAIHPDHTTDYDDNDSRTTLSTDCAK
jgi:hypothetical protein